MIKALQKAAQNEGTEIGDHWLAICEAYETLRYGSEQLKSAVKNEIEICYKDLIENYEIVEEEVVETRKVTITYLNYKGKGIDGQ